jgi:hypothetical protein
MHRSIRMAAAAAVAALAFAGSAAATPGNGKNTVLIFNECGGTSITLVSQASSAGAFATAHVVGSNAPAPLVSLAYVATAEIDGDTVVLDSGSYEHAHPQQGQPLVSCTGSFAITDPASGLEITFHITVTGFFPRGM